MVVPGVALLPMAAYQAGPRVRMGATLAHVLTLLTTVGLPSMPAVTGYGGRSRGSPACPSIDSIRAVSSPHT